MKDDMNMVMKKKRKTLRDINEESNMSLFKSLKITSHQDKNNL
jgi:hypothetical protein